MTTLRPGHWYKSKQALEKAQGLRLLDPPHKTPDGFAVLIYDERGPIVQPGSGDAPSRVVVHPPALVMQADHGHDLLHVARHDRSGRPEPAIDRVEFAVEDLSDVTPLCEYDHLPPGRQDYSVFPRGHKLI
jgi:hypothetical protein